MNPANPRFADSGAEARRLLAQIDARAVHQDVEHHSVRVRWRRLGPDRATLPPLVLLHGGHGSWMHWIRNVEALSADRVLWVPDMPGFHDSGVPRASRPGDAPLDPLLEALGGTLDALIGAGATIDLGGFSFGGLTAAKFAEKRGAVRKLALLVLSAIMAVGLSGLLGKAVAERTVHDGAAELAVEMPSSVRNGDFYETRIRVRAKEAIDKLQIEVSPALWREVTVNSMVPAAATEDFKDGYFRFEYASVAAGDAFMVKVASQVNPRLLGSVSGHIRVLDDGVVLADAERTMKVLP